MSEPRTISARALLGGVAILALLVSACTSGASAPASAQAPTPAPTASAAASASASASAEASPSGSAAEEEYEIKVATDAKAGKYLTGEDGMTLYIFKHDTANSNKSACSGGCAQAWPPFTVESADELKPDDGVTGTFATFARDDGTKQVTYNGMPLYYYATDTKAGDVTGQGVGDVWFVAAP